MSPSIAITDEIKQELAELKREDETFEELLDRLVAEDEAGIAEGADVDTTNRMEATQEERSESPDAENDR
jgi:predicted CopG family antitoxin